MTAAGSADHGHDKAIQIVINGRTRTVEAKELSFKEIVDLAYDNNPPGGPDVIITVTYRRGQGQKPEGTLVPGETVRVHDGMVFNVFDTTKGL